MDFLSPGQKHLDVDGVRMEPVAILKIWLKMTCMLFLIRILFCVSSKYNSLAVSAY